MAFQNGFVVLIQLHDGQIADDVCISRHRVEQNILLRRFQVCLLRRESRFGDLDRRRGFKARKQRLNRTNPDIIRVVFAFRERRAVTGAIIAVPVSGLARDGRFVPRTALRDFFVNGTQISPLGQNIGIRHIGISQCLFQRFRPSEAARQNHYGQRNSR